MGGELSLKLPFTLAHIETDEIIQEDLSLNRNSISDEIDKIDEKYKQLKKNESIDQIEKLPDELMRVNISGGNGIKNNKSSLRNNNRMAIQSVDDDDKEQEITAENFLNSPDVESNQVHKETTCVEIHATSAVSQS